MFKISKFKLLAILLLAFVVVCCVKEDILLDEKRTSMASSNRGAYPFIMPIDFLKIGAKIDTKSFAGDSSYKFEFSYSMLDSSRMVQREVLTGAVYTQTPLKGLLYCKTNSKLLTQDEELAEGLVRARVFHIKKEFCLQDSVSERIITMIPTAEMAKRDSSFSYLNMPDFTGTIITTSLEGEPLDVWGVKEGRISYCTFDEVKENDVFARLSFFYPSELVGGNVTTKSESDTAFNGGSIKECVVISYKKKKENTEEEEEFEIKMEPGGNLNDGPGGGGTLAPGPEDEIIGTVFYTLTLVSEFCDGMTLTLLSNHTANSNVTCAAQSSSDTSCVFYCWTQGGVFYSHRKSFQVSMNEDKAYVAIFHSKEDGDCYELAKLASDPVFMSKVDSLRIYTEQNGVEAGVAQRANGTYFKLTAGSRGSIDCNLEPGITYNSIHHTHPSCNCFPSSEDLFTLCSKLNRREIKDSESFSFVIIGGQNVLVLKIRDAQDLRGYLQTSIIKKSGRVKAAKRYLKRKVLSPILEEMTVGDGVYDYDVGLQGLLTILDDMGLYAIFADDGSWSIVKEGATGNELIFEKCVK